jgi:hypothetical protein
VVAGVVGIRHRRTFLAAERGAFVVEVGAHILLESRQSRAVEDFHRRKFQIVSETVRIVGHPFQQEAGSLAPVRVGRLPRRDPAAVEAAGECSELAIRIVKPPLPFHYRPR